MDGRIVLSIQSGIVISDQRIMFQQDQLEVSRDSRRFLLLGANDQRDLPVSTWGESG